MDKEFVNNEQQKHIVDSNGAILKNPFKMKGIYFRVIKTQGYRKNIWNVIDTIRNESNGKTSDLTREQLFKLTH